MGLKAKSTTEKRKLTVITGFSGSHAPMVVLHAMPGIAVDEPFTCDMKRASVVFRAHMRMPMPKHMHEDMASLLSALRCQGRCNCFLHGKACPVPKIKPMQTDMLILSSSFGSGHSFTVWGPPQLKHCPWKPLPHPLGVYSPFPL